MPQQRGVRGAGAQPSVLSALGRLRLAAHGLSSSIEAKRTVSHHRQEAAQTSPSMNSGDVWAIRGCDAPGVPSGRGRRSQRAHETNHHRTLAVAAAMLASGQPAMAASCNGNGHRLSFRTDWPSPGAGTTSTAIRFSVRYAGPPTAAHRPGRLSWSRASGRIRSAAPDRTTPPASPSPDAEPSRRKPCLFVQGDERKEGCRAVERLAIEGDDHRSDRPRPTPRPTPTPAPPPPPPTPKPAAAAPPAPPPAPTADPLPARPHRQPPDATSSGSHRSPIAPAVVAPSPTAIDGWWLAMRVTTSRAAWQ